MKTPTVLLVLTLAPGAAHAGDTVHGNLFLSEDTYQSVLSDIRASGAPPTAAPPAMGSAYGEARTLPAPEAGARLHGRLFESPDTDRTVLSDIGGGRPIPSAVQPGMGSADKAVPGVTRRNPDDRDPDLDGIWY